MKPQFVALALAILAAAPAATQSNTDDDLDRAVARMTRIGSAFSPALSPMAAASHSCRT